MAKMKNTAGSWLSVISLIFVLTGSIPGHAAEDNPFARVDGVELTVAGRDFRFIGASAVNLVFYDDWGLDMEKAIRQAKENNINVLRLYLDWGWGKGEDYDRVLELASKYGVFVILALTDCCCSCDYKSLEHYFKVRAPFCNLSDKRSIKAFKKRIKELVGRKNTINGKLYRDDPVIFAWEIANEPEYWRFSDTMVKEWIRGLAGYVKSIDRNHLITIGISTDKGEFDEAGRVYELFDIPELDFISLHFYPSGQIDASGKVVFESDFRRQIDFRVKEFLSLGKPVVMEETGISSSPDVVDKIRSAQPVFYSSTLKNIMDVSFLSGAAGVMFWGWGVPQEKDVPMWWNNESHSSQDHEFCAFLKKYEIPSVK